MQIINALFHERIATFVIRAGIRSEMGDYVSIGLTRLPLILALIIAGFFANVPLATAQSSDQIEELSKTIDALALDLQSIIDRIVPEQSDDATLLKASAELKKLDGELIEAAHGFSPRMIEVRGRLTQLGNPPAEGEPQEAQAISEERQQLIDQKAIINGLITKAENASILSNKQQDRLTELRRSLFFSSLSRRVDLGAVLGAETLSEAADKFHLLGRKLSSWFTFSARFKGQQMAIATFAALFAAFLLSFWGRKIFAPLINAEVGVEEPSYLSRLTVGFWSTILPTLSAAIFAYTAYSLFQVFGVFRNDIASISIVFMQFCLLLFFVYRLAHGVLKPSLPQWRLLPVTTPAARWLFGLTMLIAVVFGLDYAINNISVQLDASYNVTVLFSLVASGLIGLFVLIIAFTKPFIDDEGNPQGWPRYAFLALFILGVAPLFAAGIGYVSFSRFISQQMIVTGAILLAMYIGFLTGGAVNEDNALMDSAFGRFMATRFRMQANELDRYGLGLSFAIYALVLFLGVPLILLQWGFQVSDVMSMGEKLFTDLQIGSVSISIFAIFTAIAFFFIAYWLSRLFQRWLDREVLVRSKLDLGVRSSIRTAVGYVGIGIAGLVAISVSGFSLSNLAIVAGALSLGIGFGLQNIVSNFVSGLILLAERPFKEGDWVETDSVSGFVKKVSVRATEIETFQRQTMIVPNSELINSTVGNWTHRNRLARVEILVGVAYDSDPVRVRELLFDIVGQNDGILSFPEPQVVFLDFGASSLDFEVRFFLADVFEKVGIETNMRLEIFKRFGEEGIEFPFPQRDVNLKVSDAIRIKTET